MARRAETKRHLATTLLKSAQQPTSTDGKASFAANDRRSKPDEVSLLALPQGHHIGDTEESFRERAKMVQNLWWATGYNVVAIPLAAGVGYGAGILLSPAVGAVLMSISTVVVAINATLLGRRALT